MCSLNPGEPMKDYNKMFEEKIQDEIENLVSYHLDQAEKLYEKGMPVEDFLKMNRELSIVFSKLLLKSLLLEMTIYGDASLGLGLIDALKQDFEKEINHIDTLKEKLGEILGQVTQQPTKH